MNTLASFTATDTLWMLVCACFVFFMQAGFTCYEAGLVQSKNVISVAIENIFNLTISIVLFSLVGFPMMFGETIFSADSSAETAFVFLQIMFAAVSVTIFAGALSERTKLAPLLVAGAVSAALIYPLFGRLAWGSHLSGNASWLEKLGFLDFAGASVVHMTAGFVALAGLLAVGSRSRQHTGKSNIPLAVLGVFILWFGWYGFNGAACTSVEQLGSVFLTTTVAPAVATVVCMIFTWIKYGKPSFSLTLNGILAGLVAITAGCDTVSPFGAFIIGFVAGILVVLSVEFFDKIAKVDDPVGAVSVHFVNGVWGTIAVGLFSNGGDGVGKGLFYGGGLSQLGIQLLGLIVVDAYVLIVMFIIFKLIDKTIGLRVPAEVEIDGLDIHEHGLASAYAGFSISDANSAAMVPNENTDLGENDVAKASSKQIDAAVPVVREPAVIHDGIYDTGMHKVSIIAKLSKFDQLKTALNDLGVTGMTVTQVMGCGIQKGTSEKYRGVPVDSTLLPKIKVEVIVSKISVDSVVEAAKKALYTGHIGDGKIFVYNVTRVVKIRTGEEDFAALQDVE